MLLGISRKRQLKGLKQMRAQALQRELRMAHSFEAKRCRVRRRQRAKLAAQGRRLCGDGAFAVNALEQSDIVVFGTHGSILLVPGAA
jgi:hypothetical protein